MRAGSPHPEVQSEAGLQAALLAADAIYFPDAQRSTAGFHFAGVLRELGLIDRLEPRFRTYPNGATAMREMAASTLANPLGCTQVTEILYTEGVELVAKLPARHALGTTYTASVAAGAADPALAARFVALLAGAPTRPLREQAGFED